MKTIVWDIDDVLNNLMQSWLANHKQKNQTLTVTYAQMTQNPPHTLLNISLKTYLNSLDTFRNSPLSSTMPPQPDIYRWFQKNGEKFRHIALTARPQHTIGSSAQWLFKHFGIWIRTLSFIPSPRAEIQVPQYDTHKADFLKWIKKADYFIDDSQEQVSTVEKLGIKSFLYPQPWNKSNLTIQEILNEIS